MRTHLPSELYNQFNAANVLSKYTDEYDAVVAASTGDPGAAERAQQEYAAATSELAGDPGAAERAQMEYQNATQAMVAGAQYTTDDQYAPRTAPLLTGAVEDEYTGPGLDPVDAAVALMEQAGFERPGNERIDPSQVDALPNMLEQPKQKLEMPELPGHTGRSVPRFGESFQDYSKRQMPKDLGEAIQYGGERAMETPRPSIGPQGPTMIEPRLGDHPLEDAGPLLGRVLNKATGGIVDELMQGRSVSKATGRAAGEVAEEAPVEHMRPLGNLPESSVETRAATQARIERYYEEHGTIPLAQTKEEARAILEDPVLTERLADRLSSTKAGQQTAEHEAMRMLYDDARREVERAKRELDSSFLSGEQALEKQLELDRLTDLEAKSFLPAPREEVPA